MNKKQLIVVSLLLCCFLSACTTANYYSHISETFPPKSRKYVMPIYEGTPDLGKPYKIIGNFEVQGNTDNCASWNDVLNKAKGLARKKGADAIVNMKTDSQAYNTAVYIPSYTTYQPVTTYHSGVTSANVYGSGGYAYGTGSYSGYSTTNVPIYHPPQTIPYTAAILHCSGNLIVFLNEDEQVPIDDSSFELTGDYRVKYWYPPSVGNVTNWEKLKRGMTQEEIRAILGSPLEVTEPHNGTFMWKYNDKGRIVLGREKL